MKGVLGVQIMAQAIMGGTWTLDSRVWNPSPLCRAVLQVDVVPSELRRCAAQLTGPSGVKNKNLYRGFPE